MIIIILYYYSFIIGIYVLYIFIHYILLLYRIFLYAIYYHFTILSRQFNRENLYCREIVDSRKSITSLALFSNEHYKNNTRSALFNA